MTRTIAFLPLFALACSTSDTPAQSEKVGTDQVVVKDTLIAEGEKHFKTLKKLTFGGDNAEAYWSFGGDRLVFQSNNPAWGESCDQIYVFNPFTDDLKAGPPKKISINGGRTTCSYFLPGDSLVLFGSTHVDNAACPAHPERRSDGKYVWPIYPSFDIHVSDLQGNLRRQLTNTPGYDAEATVSPKGDRIVFTSMRDGDMDLYTMNIDGSDVKRVTNTLGYDGGAFFSPDGTKLLWRASRMKTPEEEAEYRQLLKEGLVMPTNMELYVANADGSEAKKITDLGQANWAPFWHHSGKKIIFASNHTAKRGFPFTLYLINVDGTGLEQVSFSDQFDAFPVFSPDGKYLVFSSNRANGGTRETNLFLAEWQD
ncbi:MAG: PD40 domain-containing protein [Flavobacteriales bacterium]|nr:PD40 domain-containing protein [Flavobacteriales bacterium]